MMKGPTAKIDMAPPTMTRLQRSRAQSMSLQQAPIGRAPPKKTTNSIKALQTRFSKRPRSMSTAQKPLNFVPPPITEFAQSDLPELEHGSVSRFNTAAHKDVWFVIDTTSFAKRRLNQVLLNLIGNFRGYEPESIRLHAILFYDQSLIDPLCYESTYEPVGKRTHRDFGGQRDDERMTHFEVRRIIRKALRVSAEQSNVDNVDIRTIRKVSQNGVSRLVLWGSVAREIISERTNPLDLPTTLLIFASQDRNETSKLGLEALKAMHSDQLVWYVRSFHEILQLYGEIIRANQVGPSTT
jgi:hypothetical protein